MSIPPGMPVTGAVHWSVDTQAKIIHVSVNIAFYFVSGDRRVLDIDYDRIISDIEAEWNGNHYKCYTLQVKVNPLSVRGPFDAPDDYFDIGLIGYPDFRSRVVTTTTDPKTDLSGNQNDKGVPLRGDPMGELSIWKSFNPADQPYAHEFGHLLGAPDGYFEVEGQSNGFKVPCHTKDIMWDHRSEVVSSELVTQVVQRSGDPDIANIKCPMQFDTNTTSLWMFFAEFKEFEIHARCDDYDPPSDDTANPPKPMVFTGQASFLAGYLMGNDNAEARMFLEALGVPAGPLASDQRVVAPVTFTLTQATCEEKDTDGLTSLVIPFPDMTVTGKYRWNAVTGVPVLQSPLFVSGLPTQSWYPGPALIGTFSTPDH